jgi:hypothetical protein
MADNKSGREDQAAAEQRRQRERAIQAELERMDEPEPPVDTSELAYFETELEALSFPATGAEVVDALGDRELKAVNDSYAVAELVPDTEAEAFESPSALRVRVQRPTVARAMKRMVEASDTLSGEQLSGSQWEAYEQTFRALAAVTPDDEDEGIEVVADWIVERIEQKGKLPGSRTVRKRAAKYCRSNGYSIRDDEWLGA